MDTKTKPTKYLHTTRTGRDCKRKSPRIYTHVVVGMGTDAHESVLTWCGSLQLAQKAVGTWRKWYGDAHVEAINMGNRSMVQE